MAESHREEIAKLEALYASNPGGRVFVHLAEAYRKTGEHERARRILDEGLARHPDSASGYVVLGRVLADMQVTAEAEMAFRRVLDLDAGNLVALRWLGDLARQAGRVDEALGRYRELLARNPSNEEVRELVEVLERTAPPVEYGTVAVEESGWEVLAGGDDEDEPEFRDVGAGWAAGGTDLEDRLEVRSQESPVTGASAAPGSTERGVEADLEYGFVDIEPRVGEPAGDEEPDTMVPEDASDLVAAFERGGDYEERELEELSGSSVAPTEVHLLDAALPPEESAAPDNELAELDLSGFRTSATEEVASGWTDTGSVWAGAGDEAGDTAAPEDMLTLRGDAGTPPEEVSEPEPERFDAGGFALDTPLDIVPETAGEEARAEDEFMTSAAPASEAAEYWHDQETAADEPEVGAEPERWRAEAVDEPRVEEEAAAVAGWATAGADEPRAEEGEAAVAGWTTAGADEPGTAEGEAAVAGWATAGADEPGAEEGEAAVADWATAGADEPRAEAPLRASDLLAFERRAEEIPGAGAATGPVTETMAELYRSQGLHEHAAEIYRSLLRQRPDDARLAERLREAERASEPESEDDAAGEVWLRGVGTAWTGTAPSRAEEPTPYAWTQQPEETQAGEPIRAYLRDLISWQPAAPRASAPVVSAESDWSPPPPARDMDGGSAAPEDSGPAYVEPTSWEDALSAEAPRKVPEADVTVWSTGLSGRAQDSAAETEPESFWLTAPADGEAQSHGTGGWGARADLHAEPWAEAGQASTAGEPGAPSGEAGPAGGDAGDDDREDEDLEMFRSWLQSLKK